MTSDENDRGEVSGAGVLVIRNQSRRGSIFPHSECDNVLSFLPQFRFEIALCKTAKGQQSHGANASPNGVGDSGRTELPIIRRICGRSGAKFDNGIDRRNAGRKPAMRAASGSEAALRRLIEGICTGQPNYAQMSTTT